MLTRRLLPIAATISFALAAWGAPAERFDPPTTRVALVPMVNLSGEKWEDLKQKQVDMGNDYLREAFSKRGFQIVDPWQVQVKMAELKVDMSDEEQQKRETLYRLGKAVGADLIVCALITDTDQKVRRIVESDYSGLFCADESCDIIPTIGEIGKKVLDPFMPSRKEGKAKIKLWLLDVRNERPILSAKTAEGKSTGGYFAFLDKGSKRQVVAVANALRDLLKDFLKAYPEKDELKAR